MMNPETLAITFGLSSAITWGAGDFSGGFATRKNNVLSVILFSQIVGGSLLIALQFFMAETLPESVDVIRTGALWGATAGICGCFGMVALYRGLASGRMGVVAPLSAVVTAIVPIAFSFLLEGLPTTLQITGFVAGMAAVWLLSGPGEGPSAQKTEIILSIAAGLGFGGFFICIDRVTNTAVIWPLIAARITSISILTMILASKKQLAVPQMKQMPIIALTGILDTTGNAFFALASQMGRLDVSVMLASMYPASTVMLAWCFLKERLRMRQWIGVIIAICALVMVAA